MKSWTFVKSWITFMQDQWALSYDCKMDWRGSTFYLFYAGSRRGGPLSRVSRRISPEGLLLTFITLSIPLDLSLILTGLIRHVTKCPRKIVILTTKTSIHAFWRTLKHNRVRKYSWTKACLSVVCLSEHSNTVQTKNIAHGTHAYPFRIVP